MRILQVITSLQTGGAEKIVTDLSLALMKRGHKVDVAVFNGAETSFMKKLRENGCKVICFSQNGSPYNPVCILKLIRIMGNYDVIHTHNTSAQFFTAIANLFCRRSLITTEHSTNNRRRDKKWLSYVDRWMYRQYSKVVCISEIAQKMLEDYIRTKNVDVCTINNGVDVDRFYHAEPIADMKNEDDFIVIMVAGLKEAKDHETLIKAMALLPAEYKLWLVGDGVRRGILEELVDKLNIRDRVTFLGFRDDIPNVLKTADVVVMSSHWEGLSLSNIEGMSSKKPFIASNVNGLKEVTAGAGILFPHEDAQALSDAIKKLHENQKYYQEIAEACYQRALQYDINGMVQKYEDVYRKVAAK